LARARASVSAGFPINTVEQALPQPDPTDASPAAARAPLRRAIGQVQATALVVGIIIGASIFVQPSEITREVFPSVPAVLAVWTVAGLISLAGALICAELSSAYPGTGGVYVFLRNTISPAAGFLWGWAMFWTMHTGIIAAVAFINARYAAQFLPLGDTGIRVFAVGMIALLSLVNYFGVRHGSRLQAAFTIVKVGAIVVLVLVGFAMIGGLPTRAATSAGGEVQVDAFLRAVGAGLFSFGGWHMVTYSAEETHEPTRTLPRALVLGMMIVILCYLALNSLYLAVLPMDKLIASQRVAADAADALFGSGGGTLMAGLVVFSTIGALGGLILAGPRVYFAMAEHGLWPRWFAAVHPRYQTPHRAIALQGVWACVLLTTGSYRALFTRVIYTEWIFFALMALGLMIARRRSDYAPRYRVWGFPVTPVLFALAALAVVVNQIVSDPIDSAIGLAIVLAGLPLYVWLVRKPMTPDP
jgi:basic amino acid/polyamine antiporter, APA family